MAHPHVAHITQTARVAIGTFGLPRARFVQRGVIGISVGCAQKIDHFPQSIRFLISCRAALLRISRRTYPAIFPTVKAGATRALEWGETALWQRTVIAEVQIGRR